MTATLLNVTMDCERPWKLAQFWAAVLGCPLHSDNEPADDEVGVQLDHGGELIFQRVPEPKIVKNRQHFCLRPDQPRDLEVERVVSLGARLFEDHRRPDGSGWAVLADPEGNEFCVLRSAAEL